MEKHRIFIVEDDPKIASLLADTLRKYQYDVETIREFETLIEQCMAFSPHLILLDYSMPEMDGRQALELIRADADLKTIPVIFLTSMADKEIVSEILKLKPEGYLLKPPSSEQLLSQIESVLKTI